MKSPIMFFSLKKKTPFTDDQRAFDNVMTRANTLVGQNNAEGLIDLIKIILRPIQAKHITDAYLKPDHQAIDSIYWPQAFKFSCSDTVDLFSDCLVQDRDIYPTVSLASDVVLPTSWSPHSIINILGKIGKDLKLGAFKQDYNHQLSYIYPLHFSFVSGGNHSIIQGIIHGEGQLSPTEVFDVTDLIKNIHFDGQNWVNSSTKAVIGSPLYPEFGWIWEIARLLSDCQPSPYTR